VLDLDNTLWGGVVGDDGIEGLVLDQGSPLGAAYLKVQQVAKQLHDRGILMAVSSKNDDAIARSAFLSHPEMLLKEGQFASFRANWEDKASNLRVIAETPSIGVDSLVSLDDHPAERARVRDALPEVAVPELPSDPALYAQTLLAAGHLESVAFTADDRQRARLYAANVERTRSLGAATDLSAHLRSLEMRALCKPFDRAGRARITQLVNKTNQSNITTCRYTEAEVAAFEIAEAGLTFRCGSSTDSATTAQ